MKTLNLLLPMALLAAVTTLGPVNAIASETDDVCAAITTEITFPGSNICVSIKDGVATLSGYVDNESERKQAEAVALANPAVNSVVNLITTSN